MSVDWLKCSSPSYLVLFHNPNSWLRTSCLSVLVLLCILSHSFLQFYLLLVLSSPACTSCGRPFYLSFAHMFRVAFCHYCVCHCNQVQLRTGAISQCRDIPGRAAGGACALAAAGACISLIAKPKAGGVPVQSVPGWPCVLFLEMWGCLVCLFPGEAYRAGLGTAAAGLGSPACSSRMQF